tara:strand:- start:1132 stop:1353 length:222 start_codon:yes stop_codon:yes gene_type:complete
MNKDIGLELVTLREKELNDKIKALREELRTVRKDTISVPILSYIDKKGNKMYDTNEMFLIAESKINELAGGHK